jgi:glycosyltransferase involved in cell wall biosynthesis
MKIAFFTDSYLPQRDGVASITSGLARTLVRQGHHVQVVTPAPRAASGVEVDDGIRVRRLRSVPVPLYGQYRWPVFPLGLLREAAGGADADIVHLHTPGAIGSMGFLVARRFDRPLVGTFHTNLRAMATSVPQKLLVPLFFRIAWWYNLGTYWRCDRATAPSNAARDVLLASARKPFRAPVEVIPNGVDTERFRPDARVPDWRARCGLGDAPLVTYLGRLTADKGVHRFLDAVRKVATRRPIAALVGGTGPEEARVRERLRREEDLARRVRYVGPVAESEKSALLGQSDLFVLPSTSDTSSVALLEAMACGTTVVAPAVGGASEVVNPGVTGITTDVESPDALAATIDRLLREPDERSRIAAAAARWVRSDASLESMARRFISLYRVVLTERPRRAGRVPT